LVFVIAVGFPYLKHMSTDEKRLDRTTRIHLPNEESIEVCVSPFLGLPPVVCFPVLYIFWKSTWRRILAYDVGK
jgi:hypothetical protein